MMVEKAAFKAYIDRYNESIWYLAICMLYNE